MKNLIMPTIFIAILILSFSCKDKSSNVQPKILSDSSELILDTVPISLEPCINFGWQNPIDSICGMRFIINSDSDYQSIMIHKLPSPNCTNFQLPYVNFNERTIIGYNICIWKGSSWGRYIKKIDSLKKIIYYINDTIKYKAGFYPPDDAGIELSNFMSIPKIPAGYSVEFDTTFTRINY